MKFFGKEEVLPFEFLILVLLVHLMLYLVAHFIVVVILEPVAWV